MPTRVLIVDDDEKIVKLLRRYFEYNGFAVLTAGDGVTALHLTRERNPDILILDLMLPAMDGETLCRKLREEGNDVAILMLTARDEEEERLTGLSIGADDYVTKPFSPREVVARARVILRRTRPGVKQDMILRAGDLEIDRALHEVRKKGEIIDVTPTEFDILETLASAPGQVFTRLQLMGRVQGDAFDGFERTVDAHIKNLRRKIESDPRTPELIQTVYGVGYRFSEDV